MKKFMLLISITFLIFNTAFAADKTKDKSAQKEKTVQKDIAAQWNEGVEYVYYSDGSCKPSESRVCINSDQYNAICKATKKITMEAFENTSFIKSRHEQDFISGGDLQFKGIVWRSVSCLTGWEVRGIQDGSSRRQLYVHEVTHFNKYKGEMVGTYLDSIELQQIYSDAFR